MSEKDGEQIIVSTWHGRGRMNKDKLPLEKPLEIRLRSLFDSMTCLNYLFLDLFQYRKSQADSQANSQADFQAVFPPWIRPQRGDS